MSTALAISSEDCKPLIERNKHSECKKWTTLQLLFFCFITVIISVLLSNMDRIIDIFSDNNSSSNKNLNVDILIVGGGATGMIEMNFLRQTYPNKKIILIEKQSYFGGRALSSIVSYNNTEIVMEFGARQISYNPLVWQILYYLNLCDELIDFNSNNGDIITSPISYFRNNIIDNWTLTDVFYWTNVDFNLIKNDINPFTIIYDDILNENNSGQEPQSLQEWINMFYHSNWTLNGIPILQYSLKTALTSYLNVSNEYITAKFAEFVRWSSPQMSLVGALGQIAMSRNNYSNETDDDKLYDKSAKTIKSGFSSIIGALYKNIILMDMNEDIDSIWLNTRFIGVDYNINSNNVMNKYKYLVQIDSNNDKYQHIKSINAENIILSLDIMSLIKLVSDLIPIRQELNAMNIDSLMVQQQLYKINLIFHIQDEALLLYLASKSLSRTDLEIDEFSIYINNTLILIQLYPQSNTKSIYWNQMQIMGAKYKINENLNVNNLDSLIVASNVLVNQAIIQIDELLSLSINNYSLQNPLGAFIKPFGVNQSDVDGLNAWKYNTNIATISQCIQHPNQDETIFISNGEYNAIVGSLYAVGHIQAFQSGLNLIETYFNVSNPFNSNSQKCAPP